MKIKAEKYDPNLPLGNIASLSVDAMVNGLSQVYTNLVNSGNAFRQMPSIMLWSAPGLGKSQGIRQLAAHLEKSLQRKAVVTDVRLMLFNPVDLRGIPVADIKKSVAIWLKPQIFALDPDSSIINILFLDEISSAPPSIQASAYQLVLDRAVGEHQLPENCIVIGAGNRVTDRSVAWQMPRALANRFCHLEIICDPASWRRWALENSIHELVIAYVAARPDQLHNTPKDEEQEAFPSPRTWEMVSNILSYAQPDRDAAYPFLCGCLGSGTATEFCAFCRLDANLPPMEEIFAGKCSSKPTRPDLLYALVAAMSSYASKHRDNMRAINHSIEYAMSLPPEFSTYLMLDYLAFAPSYRQKLLEMAPAFSAWLRIHKDVL